MECPPASSSLWEAAKKVNFLVAPLELSCHIFFGKFFRGSKKSIFLVASLKRLEFCSPPPNIFFLPLPSHKCFALSILLIFLSIPYFVFRFENLVFHSNKESSCQNVQDTQSAFDHKMVGKRFC